MNSISENEAVKFPVALLENTKKIFVTVRFQKVFTDIGILNMFGNALMEVSDRITDIICIEQITCKFINNALPIYNTRLNFFRLKILFQFFAPKNWLQSDANLSAEIT